MTCSNGRFENDCDDDHEGGGEDFGGFDPEAEEATEFGAEEEESGVGGEAALVAAPRRVDKVHVSYDRAAKQVGVTPLEVPNTPPQHAMAARTTGSLLCTAGTGVNDFASTCANAPPSNLRTNIWQEVCICFTRRRNG